MTHHFVFDSFGRLTLRLGNRRPLPFHRPRARSRDRLAVQPLPRLRRGRGPFLSEDPIGFSGGDANLNRYAGNSPTNATDPYGLIGVGTGGAVSGGSGGGP